MSCGIGSWGGQRRVYCKKIRDVEGIWRRLDVYVRDHSNADFSHGLCSECMPRFREPYRLRD